MVTNDRYDLVRRAVASFQGQSYQNRELVIVGEGSERLRDFVLSLEDPRIVYHTAPTPGMTLGQLRNHTLDLAQGEFVMQWDDDDWSHPARISLQMRALLDSHADMCIMIRQTHFLQERGVFAYSEKYLWENTFLAQKSVMARYPHERRGEDTRQLHSCLRAGAKLLVLNVPDLYIYTYHGNNTWDQAHFEEMFRRGTKDLLKSRTNYDRNALTGSTL